MTKHEAYCKGMAFGKAVATRLDREFESEDHFRRLCIQACFIRLFGSSHPLANEGDQTVRAEFARGEREGVKQAWRERTAWSQ